MRTIKIQLNDVEDLMIKQLVSEERATVEEVIENAVNQLILKGIGKIIASDNPVFQRMTEEEKSRCWDVIEYINKLVNEDSGVEKK